MRFYRQSQPAGRPTIGTAQHRSIGHLVAYPLMGQMLEEPAGVRRWVTGPYVVHYVIEADILTVLRIWHGREQRTEEL